MIERIAAERTFMFRILMILKREKNLGHHTGIKSQITEDFLLVHFVISALLMIYRVFKFLLKNGLYLRFGFLVIIHEFGDVVELIH